MKHAAQFILTLLLAIAAADTLSAQEWARKMFKIVEHDFGSVAKGSKQEFDFELENLYEETVHIAGVRTSCGCTTPTITKSELKTWEKGAIRAAFNTRTFLGQRSATVTVTIDKPFYAEVQLQVRGYIRSDVVFTPGHVDFGSVDTGATPARKIQISYAGRHDWQIQDVQSANSHLEVELKEIQRAGGRVTYDMSVHLKADAPEGFLQDRLLIVTDDPRMGKIPLFVEALVTPALSVSPSPLYLGEVEPDAQVQGRLVVKAKEAFKITEIRCDDAGFEIKPPMTSSKVHVIPVRYKAGSTPSRVSTTIEILTDLHGGSKVSCHASVNVGKTGSTESQASRVADRQ